MGNLNVTRRGQRVSSARLVVVTTTAALVACVHAASGIPSETTCRSTLNSIGVNNLLLRLAPCQSGPSAACCSAGQSLAGFQQSGAPLAGCLCVTSLYNEVQMMISTNTLARSVGITPDRVKEGLQQCGVPYVSGTGASQCSFSTPIQAPPASQRSESAPAAQPSPSTTAPLPPPVVYSPGLEPVSESTARAASGRAASSATPPSTASISSGSAAPSSSPAQAPATQSPPLPSPSPSPVSPPQQEGQPSPSQSPSPSLSQPPASPSSAVQPPASEPAPSASVGPVNLLPPLNLGRGAIVQALARQFTGRHPEGPTVLQRSTDANRNTYVGKLFSAQSKALDAWTERLGSNGAKEQLSGSNALSAQDAP